MGQSPQVSAVPDMMASKEILGQKLGGVPPSPPVRVAAAMV